MPALTAQAGPFSKARFRTGFFFCEDYMHLFAHKRKWLSGMALCLAAASVALPAAAHAHGHEAHTAKQKWPQASLQAEANAEIAQDTVKITLAAELSDASQTMVADALTNTLQDAMKQAKDGAKGNTAIKITSGN